MATIRILSEALANKIAAGEVVERPASVVKELVENAIDAGASQIAVEVETPVHRSIRVVDNGTGMEADDALLALERHATSKIFSDSDLGSIRTLGFRGEALPSIAAVSRLEVRTRTRRTTAGTRILAAGGVVREVSECGCPPGTQVWVRDLFFNQPARRKFLKRERTESGHVLDTLLRHAIARPEIHFSLYAGKQMVHEWPRAASTRERLAQSFRTPRIDVWASVSFRTRDLQIEGFLSPPDLHRSTSQMLLIYVNARPVRDRLLSLAVMEAYRTLLPRGRFPLGVLFLELPVEQVDVNVHPTKAEVRCQEGHGLVAAVTRAAHEALGLMEHQRWSRPLVATKNQPLPGVQIQERLPVSWGGSRGLAVSNSLPELAVSRADGPESPTATNEVGAAGAVPRFADLAIIGQLVNTYILCEAPDALVIIDQHAAHERVLFETLQAEVSSAPLRRQELMVPESLELSGEESAWLEESLPLVTRLGFTVEPFGLTTFVVRAVPAAAVGEEPLALLRDLVAEGSGGMGRVGVETMLEKLLQLMACRLAIKAGRRLKPEEMTSLLGHLDSLERSSTCPHGRALWWKITVREVERSFGRA
jgi:DNA mismatch repair protein MutL